MMLDRSARFENILATFPQSVRPLLKRLPDKGGKLGPDACQELMSQLNMSLEPLMVKMLPLAGVFATVPISGFRVGAVAQTESRFEPSQKELYLGANLEFEDQTLNATIHAEQSAVMNAWHQGGGRLLAVATSKTPCGHCRQFLNEFYGGKNLSIIQPGNQENEYRTQPLINLLPQPFTPTDLDKPLILMAPKQSSQALKLKNQSDDPLIVNALEAAALAYAPYSGNLAGCALQTHDNQIVTGRSMESVAFNPSVSALHAVIIRMNLMTVKVSPAIKRVVLVERPTKIRQKESIQMLMQADIPDIMFEYHLAQEEKL